MLFRSLAGALASLLVRALAPLLNRLSWRWQRRAMGCAAGFFLLPVGPLLALLPGIKRSTGLEPVGQALENAAQAAVHTVNISTEPVMTAPLAQPVQPVQPQLAGQLLAVLPSSLAAGMAAQRHRRYQHPVGPPLRLRTRLFRLGMAYLAFAIPVGYSLLHGTAGALGWLGAVPMRSLQSLAWLLGLRGGPGGCTEKQLWAYRV